MSAETDRLALEALRLFVRGIVRDELAAAPAAVEAYVGTREAARRAGVTADCVLEWIARGLMPATRPPSTKSWRIRPADLEALLSERSGATPPTNIAAKRVERAARLAAAVTKAER